MSGRQPSWPGQRAAAPSSDLSPSRRGSNFAGQAAHRLRQLRHPQAPENASLADQEPTNHALNTDLGIVAEHRPDLLRRHHPASHSPRQLHLGQRTIAAIETSSTAGTNAATHSHGPRPPTRSWQQHTVTKVQTRNTRASRVAEHRECAVNPGQRCTAHSSSSAHWLKGSQTTGQASSTRTAL